MKILLVDDQADMRDWLERRLVYWRHEVTTAQNGREAFQLLQQSTFDALITDVQMPGGGGIELLERIAVDPDLHLPTYVHSGDPYYVGGTQPTRLEALVPGDKFPFAIFHLKDRATTQHLREFLEDIKEQRR